jgi:hypothetical protein
LAGIDRPSSRHGHVLLTMKVLNRNQELIVGSPMRGVRAQTACLLAGLALAGYMQTTYPVASAPRSDLDTLAYGQLSFSPTASAAVAIAGGFSPRWF